jgi:DNA-binding MarR family transcriptional regulator
MLSAQTAQTDKGYILMNEIEANQVLSQRELSQKTGLSLGTVNLMLQKMIKQGLIKMETIPANRVIYMLTPMGIAEKAAKTVLYIRSHYHIIQETKNMIQQKLARFHRQYDVVYFCMPENELDALVQTAINEYQDSHTDQHVYMISRKQALHSENLPQIHHAVILYLPDETIDSEILQSVSPAVPLINLLRDDNIAGQ